MNDNYLKKVILDEACGGTAVLLKVLLEGLSFIYRAAAGILRRACLSGLLPRKALDRPVISVGNITWGGTGKTPLVEHLVGFLAGQGIRPAVLTRGYQAPNRRGGQPASSANDEALVFCQRFPDVPLGIGRDRLTSAQKILKAENVDVFLLDDGFQQWRIPRDLDIVVIDATRPFGNGKVLPRGILREPLSQLARADVFVLTRVDQGADQLDGTIRTLRTIQPKAVIAKARHTPVRAVRLSDGVVKEPGDFQGCPVWALSAIGNPGSFEQTLLSLGMHVEGHLVFRDHHWFGPEDIQHIVRDCRTRKPYVAMTTSKDSVRLKSFLNELSSLEVWELQIELVFVEGREEIDERIRHLLFC